jgi:hypothetical protein
MDVDRCMAGVEVSMDGWDLVMIKAARCSLKKFTLLLVKR